MKQPTLDIKKPQIAFLKTTEKHIDFSTVTIMTKTWIMCLILKRQAENNSDIKLIVSYGRFQHFIPFGKYKSMWVLI